MNKPPPGTTIAISDESPFIIESVKSLLSLSGEMTPPKLVAYPTQYEKLLSKLEVEPAHILITDFNLAVDGSVGGSKKIDVLCRRFPKMKIVIFTSLHTPRLIMDVLKQPIRAMVSKKDESEELSRALRLVGSGQSGVYLSERIRSLIDREYDGQKKEELTSPELEVIRLFAMGYSLTEIAKNRKRSVSTVATQKNNAMRKLYLTSNTELIKYLFSQEII
ncbi:LuxR C-terminal-related transcriptional regulator [Enterobacteriaceae bacterium C23F]